MALPEIADLIADSTDELVRVWVQAVRSDVGIRSDGDLTEGGLIVRRLPITAPGRMVGL
jgi:hypothetical protein